jgi:hypothetical protein
VQLEMTEHMANSLVCLIFTVRKLMKLISSAETVTKRILIAVISMPHTFLMLIAYPSHCIVLVGITGIPHGRVRSTLRWSINKKLEDYGLKV